jgi:hypothetical protein
MEVWLYKWDSKRVPSSCSMEMGNVARYEPLAPPALDIPTDQLPPTWLRQYPSSIREKAQLPRLPKIHRSGYPKLSFISRSHP